jgi:hypothetical protein
MQQMDRDRDKNSSSNARPPTLLDKQLEDILRTAERTRRRRLFWQRLRNTGRGLVAWRRRGRRVESGRLMGLGFVLCLVAGFLGRGAPMLSSVLVLLGAILFLSPIVLNYGRRGGPGGREERLWRGRVVDYSDDQRWRTTQAWIGRMLRRFRGGGPRGGRR